MSFSNHVAEAMHEADAAFVPTLYAAPSAPPSHSYACFLKAHADRADENPVQVLGVLASSVKGLLTLGGATRSFEAPNPYTFPRYTLAPDGQLTELRPVIGSVEDLRAALADDARWAAHVDQLAQHDRFYDPLLMGGAAADRSALVRMARRGYAQHGSRAVAKGGADGFGDDPEVGPVLRAIVRDFARRSRAAGRVPFVLLIHDRGYRDELHRLLAPALEADGVPYVSTHDVAPTSDPSNFIGDGHFTRDANRRIGQRAATTLKAALAGPRQAGH
jgi:hypothetical protein